MAFSSRNNRLSESDSHLAPQFFPEESDYDLSTFNISQDLSPGDSAQPDYLVPSPKHPRLTPIPDSPDSPATPSSKASISSPPSTPTSKASVSSIPSTPLTSAGRTPISPKRDFRRQHASSPEPDLENVDQRSARDIDLASLQAILSSNPGTGSVAGLMNTFYAQPNLDPVSLLAQLQLQNLELQLQQQNLVMRCQVEQYNAIRTMTTGRFPAPYQSKPRSPELPDGSLKENITTMQHTIASTAKIMASLRQIQNYNAVKTMWRPGIPLDYYGYLSTLPTLQEHEWSRQSEPREACRLALAHLQLRAAQIAQGKTESRESTRKELEVIDVSEPSTPKKSSPRVTTTSPTPTTPTTPSTPTTSSPNSYHAQRQRTREGRAKEKKPEFFTCEFCGQVLKTRFSLNRHFKIHQGVKPYICQVPGCGKSFPESNTLKRHLRVHTGERPFECKFENCGKAFTDASNWRRHERTHNGEKPYKCPFACSRCFSRGISLKKHMIKLHNLAPNDPAIAQAVKRSPIKEAETATKKTKSRPHKRKSQLDDTPSVHSQSVLHSTLRTNPQ